MSNSLKPSSWTRSLQIHCNGSTGPRSRSLMGPVRKSWPYKSNFLYFFRKGRHSYNRNKIKSWYKASKAGGVESSNQYKSWSKCLACWAKTCATLLPLLLILLVETHYNLDIKWRISSTTLPRKENLAASEEIACITLELAPSITSQVNPESTANSIDRLHARSSAFSLVSTYGPIADIPAMTSLLSFLMIAPIPDFSSLEKIAASKFNYIP